MDNGLVGALIVAIVFITIYRVFELFVRRNERLSIIDKLGGQVKFSDANADLNLPLFQKFSGSSALKISLLLIGVGIGLLVGYGIEFAVTDGDLNFSNNWDFQRKIGVVYFASVAIFGGLGLLAAYFIERKNNRKGS